MDIIYEDALRIKSAIDVESYLNKTVFITGATGLIGKTLVPALAEVGAKVVLLVRSEQKGRALFGDSCTYIVGNTESLPEIEIRPDYIIHMASPTASLFFVNNPVETIKIAVRGTMNLLELARKNSVNGFVYLSSMEVYGNPKKGHKVREEEVAGFDTRVARNSYPISKIQCEMLCSAYAREYGVPAKILRLTQTFGPGVQYDDKRIFGEFMRCVVERKNIVLHTKGETERSYLYTADAVEAILKVLIFGENGEIYNVANPETYCSIKEMAERVARLGSVSLEYQIDEIQRGYADTLYMDLDISKLIALGWMPTCDLEEIFARMIAYRVGCASGDT